MNFVGIDPGKGGGIAVVSDDGGEPLTAAFSEDAYRRILGGLANCGPSSTIAVVEAVHAMPGQGVTSCFTFGMNYGWILGLCYALGVPVETASPNAWKREFGLRAPKGATKAEAKRLDVECAMRLFPNADFKASPKCRVPHDGIADALLIAEYGRRRCARGG